MKNISVIGAGTMGNGIAHVFAQNGYQVNLIDVSQEALEKAVKGMLPKGPLGYAMVKKLKIYSGDQHEHSAQQPKPLTI